MVSTSTVNKVWMYLPNIGSAGLYQLDGQRAKDIVADSIAGKLPVSGLTALSSGVDSAGTSSASMSFKLTSLTEPGILPANLAGSNKLIYANGGVWPEVHPKGSYG